MKNKLFVEAAGAGFRLLRKSFGWLLVLTAFSGTAWGFDPVAPEIDPGSAIGSLTLLAGGVLLLYDRYRRN